MRKILTLATSILIAATAVGGDIYRWKDANGTWHYSDQPQPGAELVHRTGLGADSAATPAAAAPAPAPSQAADGTPPPVSDEVAAQVRQEAAAAKNDQCKKAQDVYQKAVQARVVKKTDDKGNASFLSNSEIDAYRLQARSARDVACGPGP